MSKTICPECGNKTKEAKFCNECGYKLTITEEVKDKTRTYQKIEEIIESDSPIEIPKKLTLMPGERLLE